MVQLKQKIILSWQENTKLKKNNTKLRKSHTCQEGGTHHIISFWYLLTNLKNKYLLKRLLKKANKKQNNLNIYNVAFFVLKNKEKHLEISLFTPVYQISWWSTVPETGKECNWLNSVIIGHFLPYYHPKNQKSKFWNDKNS